MLISLAELQSHLHMKLHIRYMLMLVLCLAEAKAQEQFIEPPSRFISSIPFRMLTGGVVMIKAKVNDYPDSLNFILDTGSGGISLDSTTVVEFGIPVVPSDKSIKGIAGLRKVSFLYNAVLKLPGVETDRLNFHVNDYDILTSVYGIKVDGIIGYSFLSRYIINLDYDTHLMHVHSVGDYKYPNGGHLLNPMFTALPMLQTRFRDNGHFEQRFYLDIGAGLNFLLSDRYANDSMVISKKRRGPFLTQAEGLGGKTTMRLTTVREVRVGPYRFRHVPTLLFSDDYNVTNYPFVGGLIGNDLLRRFNITFNYPKQQVHIIPNKYFQDLFDYAYTGMSIYDVDGKIMVDEVVPGSPADKAGFRQDDIVIAVDNDLSNNIIAYKTHMQQLGQKIKILVSRNGVPMMLYLKPVSIL